MAPPRCAVGAAVAVALLGACAAPRALAATNVSVALVHDPPWTYFGLHGSYYGIVPDVLNYLRVEAALPCVDSADLACGLTFFLTRIFADWDNATAALNVGLVDMLPALAVTPSALDTGMLRYSVAWRISDLAFVTKQVPVPRGFTFITQPLDKSTWAAFAGGLMLIALSIACMDHWRGVSYGPSQLAAGCVDSGSAAHAESPPEPQGLRDAVYRASLALVGVATRPPPSHGQRLVHLAAFALYFFIGRSYLARLTALASLPSYQVALESWEDLQGAGPLGYVPQTAAAGWLNASTALSLHALLPQLVPFPNASAAAAAIRSGRVAALITDSVTASFVSLEPPCDPAERLVAVIDKRSTLGIGGFAWLAASPPKGGAPDVSAYVSSAVNEGLIRLLRYGYLAGFEASYVHAPGNCESGAGGAVSAQAVTASDLLGAVVLFGAVLAVTANIVAYERAGGTRRCLRLISRRCARWCGCCKCCDADHAQLRRYRIPEGASLLAGSAGIAGAGSEGAGTTGLGRSARSDSECDTPSSGTSGGEADAAPGAGASGSGAASPRSTVSSKRLEETRASRLDMLRRASAAGGSSLQLGGGVSYISVDAQPHPAGMGTAGGSSAQFTSFPGGVGTGASAAIDDGPPPSASAAPPLTGLSS